MSSAITRGTVEVRGLTKSFGPVRAVDGLSFTVRPGSVTGFLGRNGAGKTTTLRMLLGLVRPDAGTATIGGRAYRDIPAPAGEVGAALDATGFHPARSGRAHLRVLCTVNGYPRTRADDTLGAVGLAAAGGRRAGGYSLGMRQRLALSAALLGDPGVLVLDEPANGLDPEGIVWMRALLRDFAARGRTVLVSSHVLSEMQQLVDDVVIVEGGRDVYQGSLADLAARHGTVVDVRTRHPGALRAALARRSGVGVDSRAPDRLQVTGIDAATVGQIAHAAGVELTWLAEQTRDLERLFLTLTAGTAGAAHHTAAREVGVP